MLAVKAYRDYFKSKNPDVTEPEVLMCRTAHPAFNKAAALFNVKIVYVECDEKTKRMRVDQVEAKITNKTCVIVASAP